MANVYSHNTRWLEEEERRKAAEEAAKKKKLLYVPPELPRTSAAERMAKFKSPWGSPVSGPMDSAPSLGLPVSRSKENLKALSELSLDDEEPVGLPEVTEAWGGDDGFVDASAISAGWTVGEEEDAIAADEEAASATPAEGERGKLVRVNSWSAMSSLRHEGAGKAAPRILGQSDTAEPQELKVWECTE
jgi:hypothetical protein